MQYPGHSARAQQDLTRLRELPHRPRRLALEGLRCRRRRVVAEQHCRPERVCTGCCLLTQSWVAGRMASRLLATLARGRSRDVDSADLSRRCQQISHPGGGTVGDPVVPSIDVDERGLVIGGHLGSVDLAQRNGPLLAECFTALTAAPARVEQDPMNLRPVAAILLTVLFFFGASAGPARAQDETPLSPNCQRADFLRDVAAESGGRVVITDYIKNMAQQLCDSQPSA